MRLKRMTVEVYEKYLEGIEGFNYTIGTWDSKQANKNCKHEVRYNPFAPVGTNSYHFKYKNEFIKVYHIDHKTSELVLGYKDLDRAYIGRRTYEEVARVSISK